MERMTVGEFKAHFSDVLKKVQAGKEIGISYGKRKQIVAKLVPPDVNKGSKRKIGVLEGKSSVKFNKGFKLTEEELLGL
jgi:antitoxin (DNA-binding transcriptional repressor) of toxin-antitoxin stability system